MCFPSCIFFPITQVPLNQCLSELCEWRRSVWYWYSISALCICVRTWAACLLLQHQRPDGWVSVHSFSLSLFCQSGKAVVKGAEPHGSGDVSRVLSGFLIPNPAALTAASHWTNIHIWVFLLSTRTLLLLEFWQENVQRCRTSDALMNSTATSGRNKALCWVRSARLSAGDGECCKPQRWDASARRV